MLQGSKGWGRVLQFNRYMDYIKYNHRAWLVLGVVLGGRGVGGWVGEGATNQFQISYLACCLQRRRKGQWTMQLEELLDEFKEETNKQTKTKIT